MCACSASGLVTCTKTEAGLDLTRQVLRQRVAMICNSVLKLCTSKPAGVACVARFRTAAVEGPAGATGSLVLRSAGILYKTQGKAIGGSVNGASGSGAQGVGRQYFLGFSAVRSSDMRYCKYGRGSTQLQVCVFRRWGEWWTESSAYKGGRFENLGELADRPREDC